MFPTNKELNDEKDLFNSRHIHNGYTARCLFNIPTIVAKVHIGYVHNFDIIIVLHYINTFLLYQENIYYLSLLFKTLVSRQNWSPIKKRRRE